MVENKNGKVSDLGQRRAAHAWQCVQGIDKEYTNLAKSAPALIMSNGLMPTLAFYKAKKQGHHAELLCHIISWLKLRFSGIARADFESTISFLYSADTSDYRRATEESLELLRWVRQFAPAVSGESSAEQP